ncbi:ATP-dependent protease La (LON) domain [Seminavis robusta]|uniref:ATP-dependent protease La (LON) domain n=1 Tax=Seminavis robusta TaxID=568900 RepID=A0A9N8ES86_9STRA|nr:ATP-dependent protease La (LON) domain [Seminavis robusta]|eukprot:Sro1537_g280660.1 ATP-dependent protease La (LON) domain (374) ;mRNA; f:8964-10085
MAAFSTGPVSATHDTPHYYVPSPRSRSLVPLSSSSQDSSFDMSELSRRIEGLQTAENVLANDSDGIISLPVIAFDALLPNQRMKGRTTDRTFGRLLAGLGLGGLFCMVSVNHAHRKVRRNGVICRIELCDAPASGNSANGRAMTAVDFQLVGLRRCRLVGPPTGMKARIGRWRRMYCPDGEGSKLGFGDERFVDVYDHMASQLDDDNKLVAAEDATGLPSKRWTQVPVDCDVDKGDKIAQNEDPEKEQVVERAHAVIALLDKWEKLASDVKTYENTDVVAGSRVMKGQPGLRVDPAALLRVVRKDIGPRPSPEDPTSLALWGASLINPLPSLGVAPEIRGKLLESPSAMDKLDVLEAGLKRSIGNLEGNLPLF